MEKRDFIDKLFKESSDFKNEKQARIAANLLNTVSSDIYSESQRFVFELIQNADDAAEDGENEVKFDFVPGALMVSHNGKKFSMDDIDSITDAGSSTKKDDADKTGYKGIGFKSVFGMSERVSIFSDGYQFRFEKLYHKTQLPWQIIPIWSEKSDYSDYISLNLEKLNYNVTTVIEVPTVNTLYSDLQEIMSNAQILLFLRFVSKITVSRNGVEEYTISKQILENTSAFSKVCLYQDTKVISEWLVKNYKKIPIPPDTRDLLRQDDKAPEKLKKAEITEMSFAAKLENEKITSIGRGESLIFTYLPTKVREFNFPFLVNGGFMTSAAREALFEDRPWNQWLFSLIAEKAVAWLCELAETIYKFQVLHIIPTPFSQDSNHLKKSFDTAFAKFVKQGRFITTGQLSLQDSTSVLLDDTGLSLQAFIDKTSITDFIRLTTQKNFQSDCFVHPELEKAHLLKAVGVETFDKENIGPYFISEPFKKSHNLTQNFHLIEYLKKLSDGDSSGVWFQTLKSLPFIFNTEETLCNPETGICFPTGVIDTELGKIPVIHTDIYRNINANKHIYDWLEKLGVTEPSSVAYVTTVIIPNLSALNYINKANYLSITNYLFRLFHKNELTADMLESLRELKLLTVGPLGDFVQAQHTFLSDKYRPKFSIQRTITEVPYVSEDYLAYGNDLKWNEFFRAIKVKEDIEIEEINGNNDLNTLKRLTNPDWVKIARSEAESKGGFGFGLHNRINNLRIPSFLHLTATNYEYAVMFWKRLVDAGTALDQLNEKAIYLYGEGRGYNNWVARVGNYFPWFVTNMNCIPTSTGELLKSSEVFINSGDIKEIAGKLLPVFEFPNIVPASWKVLFQFKAQLKLEDYLLLLEKICVDAESEEPKERSKIQRIGMIYNKLSEIVEDMADLDKIVISEWAVRNRVLTGRDIFEDPSTLKWVTIPGFAEESTNLKTIKIPSNTKYERDGFKELMTLFGVQIINEFIPSYVEPKEDDSLKAKLENILPHLAALAERKTVDDNGGRFDKLYDTLNETRFFSAKEIKLCFEFEGERFDGPTMTIYRDKTEVYFKGKWTSERTLLHLIKELSDLLKLRQLDAELRFLLMESDKSEIEDWMAEQGIDLTTLVAIRRFTRQLILESPSSKDLLSPQDYTYETDLRVNDILQNVENKFEVEEPTGEYFYDQRENNAEREVATPVFNPVTSVENFDFGSRTWKSVSNDPISISSQKQYEKIEDEEYRARVGRWSEEYVHALLLHSSDFSEVKWMNEFAESGGPYDFTAIKDGQLFYIEVKGTQSHDKNLIYLSNKEWHVLQNKGENYLLIRIYEAGSVQCRHQVFENPALLIDTGAISVALEL